MPKRAKMAGLFALSVALIAPLAFARLQHSVQKDSRMLDAKGTFDVKLVPLTPYNQDDKTLGRFGGEKEFHGGLEGTSKVEMLSAGNPATSGGYVAIEKFAGKLNGLSGSFVLQHSGTMQNGKAHLDIAVVPGSGTGDLTGIAGKMEIIIASGKHSYDFEYTLPKKSS